MSESILDTTKKSLGAENLTEFDDNLKMFINGALNILTQNGVGPVTGFRITGNETWSEFLQTDHEELYELCKEFIYLDVKMVFDPPIGSVMDYYKARREEVLWRIREQADPADIFEVDKEA